MAEPLEKEGEIIKYINAMAKLLREQGYPISDEQIENTKNEYLGSSKSIEEIKLEIAEKISNYIKSIKEARKNAARMPQEKFIHGTMDSAIKPIPGLRKPNEELSSMFVQSGEPNTRAEQKTPPQKSSQMVKRMELPNKDKKGFAEVLSLTSSITIIIGIVIALMIILLIVK